MKRIYFVLLLVLGFLAAIAPGVLWPPEQPVNEQARVHAHYAGAKRLDYSFYSETEQIVELFSDATPFVGRIAVNLPSPAENGIMILLVDTRNAPGGDPSGLPYYERLKRQCLSIPGDRIVLCDTKVLDSIIRPIPIVADESARAAHIALMKKWIIGHELAHIMLGHGTRSAFGLFGEGGDEGVVRTGLSDREHRPEATSQCDEADWSAADDRLFFLEAEADRFVVEKLRVDANLAVQANVSTFGNLYLQLLQEAREKSAESAEPGMIVLNYTYDQHPPFLLRMRIFNQQARERFRDFYISSFYYEDVKFCLRRRSVVPALQYFFGGTYIGDSTDAPLDRALSPLVSAAVETYRTSQPPTHITEDIDFSCEESDGTCLGELYVKLLKGDACPKKDALNAAVETAAQSLDVPVTVGSWRGQALRVLQGLHTLRCAKVGMVFSAQDAYLSYVELHRNGAKPFLRALHNDLTTVIDAHGGEAKLDLFYALANLTESLGWYELGVKTMGRARDALRATDGADIIDVFNLSRQQSIFMFRSGTFPIDEIANFARSNLDEALATWEAETDPERKRALSLITVAMGNDAVFRMVLGRECDLARTTAYAVMDGISENSPTPVESIVLSKLKASTVAAEVCLNATFDQTLFEDTFSSIDERIVFLRAMSQDASDLAPELQDAAQGFLTLTAWAALAGDAERRARAASRVAELFQLRRDHTFEKQFEGLSTSVAGRIVPILDLFSDAPLDLEAYPLLDQRLLETQWTQFDL